MLSLKGSERAATTMTLHSLLLSLLLHLAANFSEASENNKDVSLLFLNTLDEWESKCTSNAGKVFGPCSEYADYDSSDGSCNQIITCVEENLKSRLSHFPNEVQNQIGNIRSRLCQTVGNEDVPEPIMKCFDSKKSLIKNCLEKQADTYCNWKKKNDSRTIYTDQFKKLTNSISSCVLDRVSNCIRHRETTDFFTGVFKALEEDSAFKALEEDSAFKALEKDSASSGTPPFTFTKTLSFLAVILAFTVSLL